MTIIDLFNELQIIIFKSFILVLHQKLIFVYSFTGIQTVDNIYTNNNNIIHSQTINNNSTDIPAILLINQHRLQQHIKTIHLDPMTGRV